MQIKLIVVGNVKETFYQNKIEEFQKQINKKISIQLICLKDESIPKQTSETVIRKIKETEGEKILSQIQNTDYVAALCIDGKKMDNSKIKKSIATAEQRGKSSIAFVIGGSLGLSRCGCETSRREDQLFQYDISAPVDASDAYGSAGRYYLW